MEFDARIRMLRNVVNAPNTIAEWLAYITYDKLIVKPSYIDSSHDGGIIMTFKHAGKYCDIECYNDGDIMTAVCNEKTIIKSWKEEEIGLAVIYLEKFLCGI